MKCGLRNKERIQLRMPISGDRSNGGTAHYVTVGLSWSRSQIRWKTADEQSSADFLDYTDLWLTETGVSESCALSTTQLPAVRTFR